MGNGVEKRFKSVGDKRFDLSEHNIRTDHNDIFIHGRLKNTVRNEKLDSCDNV